MAIDKATVRELTLPGAIVFACLTALTIFFGGGFSSSPKDTLTPEIAKLTAAVREGVSAMKEQMAVKASIDDLRISMDRGFEKMSEKTQDVQIRTAKLENKMDAFQAAITALSNLMEWCRACISALNARANIVPPIKEP